MNFTLFWTEQALDSIEHILAAAADPGRILASIQELDQELTRDPQTKGESRPGGRRIVFAHPLAVLFEVHWRLNEVVVAEVWKFE